MLDFSTVRNSLFSVYRLILGSIDIEAVLIEHHLLEYGIFYFILVIVMFFIFQPLILAYTLNSYDMHIRKKGSFNDLERDYSWTV
jgi:hypothetical protein